MLFSHHQGTWRVNDFPRTHKYNEWAKIPGPIVDYLEDVGFSFDARHRVPPIKRDRLFTEPSLLKELAL